VAAAAPANATPPASAAAPASTAAPGSAVVPAAAPGSADALQASAEDAQLDHGLIFKDASDDQPSVLSRQEVCTQLLTRSREVQLEVFVAIVRIDSAHVLVLQVCYGLRCLHCVSPLRPSTQPGARPVGTRCTLEPEWCKRAVCNKCARSNGRTTGEWHTVSCAGTDAVEFKQLKKKRVCSVGQGCLLCHRLWPTEELIGRKQSALMCTPCGYFFCTACVGGDKLCPGKCNHVLE
jgi:hypothetical protein